MISGRSCAIQNTVSHYSPVIIVSFVAWGRRGSLPLFFWSGGREGRQIYTTKAGQQGTVEFFLNIIPATVVGAFAEGEILQVLFFAILFAFALSLLGERGKRCST